MHFPFTKEANKIPFFVWLQDDSNLSDDASQWVDAQRLPTKAIPIDEASPRVNPEKEEARNGETTRAKVA